MSACSISTEALSEFGKNGFCILRNFLTEDQTARLLETLSAAKPNDAVKQKQGSIYGIRDLLNQIPQLRSFANSNEMQRLLLRLFDQPSKLVRAIYFDKTKNANWGVLWHQDTTIALRHKAHTVGFEAWTVKSGIHHARPPVDYMQRMVSIRIHLDDYDENNGALRVIPASHRQGFLNEKRISELANNGSAVLCAAPRGSIMLMKPLLLHSSSTGAKPSRRRVIHFEFSPDALPAQLQWYNAA